MIEIFPIVKDKNGNILEKKKKMPIGINLVNQWVITQPVFK